MSKPDGEQRVVYKNKERERERDRVCVHVCMFECMKMCKSYKCCKLSQLLFLRLTSYEKSKTLCEGLENIKTFTIC